MGIFFGGGYISLIALTSQTFSSEQFNLDYWDLTTEVTSGLTGLKKKK